MLWSLHDQHAKHRGDSFGIISLYEGGMCTLHLQQLLNLLVEASQAAALGLSCG